MSEDFRYTALKLCGFFTGVYGLQVISGVELGFRAADPVWWRFLTSTVAHSGPEHLMNNLFFIGLFGTFLELAESAETMLATFTVSALFANLSSFIFFPESVIIGASGGAFGILALMTVLHPRKIGLGLGVPLPMWAVLALYTAINVAGLSVNSPTAHEAHLMGALAGAAMGLHLRTPEHSEGDETPEELETWQRRIEEWERRWMMD